MSIARNRERYRRHLLAAARDYTRAHETFVRGLDAANGVHPDHVRPNNEHQLAHATDVLQRAARCWAESLVDLDRESGEDGDSGLTAA